MNDNAAVNNLVPLVAVAVGILNCFWGYRILKLTLAIVGLVGGAAGGWELASSLAPGNNLIGLVAAVAGGVVGAVLCVWLFLLGIFLLGASAGAAMGIALSGPSGNQHQTILVLGLAIIFGVVAVLVQKFMIVISTAFSGSYLLTAVVLHFFTGSRNPFPLWFRHPQIDSGHAGYAALVLWVIIGVAGVSFQYRSGTKTKADSTAA